MSLFPTVQYAIITDYTWWMGVQMVFHPKEQTAEREKSHDTVHIIVRNRIRYSDCCMIVRKSTEMNDQQTEGIIII